MHLVLDQVSRSFNGQVAIENVTTSFSSGSVTAILGANGAGKTTLLKLLAGVLPVESGKITFDDHLIKPSRANIRRELLLLDTPRVGDQASTVSLFTKISDYQVDRPSLAQEVADWFVKLNLVGVYGKKARALSKGQRYKLEMIGLFVARPTVWLLDEPFSNGLDANGLSLLITEIRKHSREGGIVLFSTQWPEQAKQVVDRFMVINEGKLVWDAPAAEIPHPDLLSQSDVSLKAVLLAIKNNG